MSVPGRDEEGPLPWDVIIPDDISELEAEVLAFQREQRRRQRRAWWAGRLFTRRWYRYGLSGPLVVLVLAGVALVGSLLAILGPKPQQQPAQRPLARQVKAIPGTIGGLLPATEVIQHGVTRDVQALRPAVLTFVPVGCTCAVILESLFRQAREYQVDLYLVSDEPHADEVHRLAADTGNGSVTAIVDPQHRLAAAYRPSGVTAVLVNSSGVVTAVERGLEPGLRLEPRLNALRRSDQAG